MTNPPARANSSWKRQAAIFGAAVSALVGLGILIVVFFAAREHSPPPVRAIPNAAPAKKSSAFFPQLPRPA